MNRRDFFNKLLIGIGASIIMPKELFSKQNVNNISKETEPLIPFVYEKIQDVYIGNDITIPAGLIQMALQAKKFVSKGFLPPFIFVGDGELPELHLLQKFDYRYTVPKEETNPSRVSHTSSKIEINLNVLKKNHYPLEAVHILAIWCYVKFQLVKKNNMNDSDADILTMEYCRCTNTDIKSAYDTYAKLYKNRTDDNNIGRMNKLTKWVCETEKVWFNPILNRK